MRRLAEAENSLPSGICVSPRCVQLQGSSSAKALPAVPITQGISFDTDKPAFLIEEAVFRYRFAYHIPIAVRHGVLLFSEFHIPLYIIPGAECILLRPVSATISIKRFHNKVQNKVQKNVYCKLYCDLYPLFGTKPNEKQTFDL